jgi:hypothetical protein
VLQENGYWNANFRFPTPKPRPTRMNVQTCSTFQHELTCCCLFYTHLLRLLSPHPPPHTHKHTCTHSQTHRCTQPHFPTLWLDNNSPPGNNRAVTQPCYRRTYNNKYINLGFWVALGTESRVCYPGNPADRQPQWLLK